MKLKIDSQPIGLGELRAAWEGPLNVELGDEARRRVIESNQLIAAVIASGEEVYGVNTGFGQLANVHISNDELAHLQVNLVRSHAVGVGVNLDDEVVRLIMLMKVVALAQGYSGVRPVLIDSLCALINRRVYPCIPAQGSVGASGDLAPLAHMASVLIGAGEARVDGTVVPAQVALQEAGIAPLTLAPKEGLALLNGTQVSTALALAAVFRTEHVLAAALAAGAMSSDAVKGSDIPFEACIQQVRGHAGQIAIAGVLRELMSAIRCQPQVIGACLGVLRHVCEVLEIEANAVTDNPLVFAGSKKVLSGGNFHAEPVALVADYLALAIAEIGSLSERRIALLIDSHLSGLPPFLVREGGLNSGFMMAQVTAAALTSENKSMAHPASVDSIPTSANQEDHVSMATFAARRLHAMLDNVTHIIAIELLGAAQGVEFHRPQRTSPALEQVISALREVSPAFVEDRSLSADIMRVADLIAAGRFCKHAATVLPSVNA
jgi:histidine ammonia-lyase